MFSFNFLVRALVAAVLSSFSLAIFSPFVSLRRISYLGEAFSHMAFAGIAIALVTGLNGRPVTLIFVIVLAYLIGWLSKRYKLEETNTITIFLSVSMAFAIILISLSSAYAFDLSSYLFGNVLLVNSGDLIWVGIMAVLSLAFIIIFYHQNTKS